MRDLSSVIQLHCFTFKEIWKELTELLAFTKHLIDGPF